MRKYALNQSRVLEKIKSEQYKNIKHSMLVEK